MSRPLKPEFDRLLAICYNSNSLGLRGVSQITSKEKREKRARREAVLPACCLWWLERNVNN